MGAVNNVAIPPGFGLFTPQYLLTGDSEPMVVTLGLDLTAWAGDFQGAVDRATATWKLEIHDEVMGNGYTLTKGILYVGQDGGASIPFETNVNDPGPGTGDRLPQNCAVLVDKLTAVAGRRGKGRLYLPGSLSESKVNNIGVITAADLVVHQTIFDDLFDNLNLVGPGAEPVLPPVLFHATGDQTPTPLTAFSVQPVIATQRQRLRR